MNNKDSTMRIKSIIERLNAPNDQQLSRPLFESIVAPEVTSALAKWIGSTKIPGVLIGGLALSFYVKPRYTMDVDVLYVTDQEIPTNIPGFKKIRPHTFQHNDTHVEVEVLSADFLHLPIDLINKVIKTAVVSNGMKIASKSGLVALKLQRGKLQDQADIVNLIATGGVDITPYSKWLTPKQVELFDKLQTEV